MEVVYTKNISTEQDCLQSGIEYIKHFIALRWTMQKSVETLIKHNRPFSSFIELTDTTQ